MENVVQDPPYQSENSVLVFPHLRDWLRECKSLGGEDEKFVIDFITGRHFFGVEKYGTGLTTHNGRDANLDAIQELGDCLQYLYQIKLEGKSVSRETRILLQTLVELTS